MVRSVACNFASCACAASVWLRSCSSTARLAFRSLWVWAICVCRLEILPFSASISPLAAVTLPDSDEISF